MAQRSKKQQLKEEIEELKWQLIESSLREQDKLEHIDKLEVLRHKNIKHFLWKLEFTDVFKENGGFGDCWEPTIWRFDKGDERKMVLSSGKFLTMKFITFVQLSKLLSPKGKGFIIPNTFLFNVAATYRKSLLKIGTFTFFWIAQPLNYLRRQFTMPSRVQNNHPSVRCRV